MKLANYLESSPEDESRMDNLCKYRVTRHKGSSLELLT